MRFYGGLDRERVNLSASVLTVGNFDGVHLGHQAILAKVKERARAMSAPSALLTFDPHPAQVLHPEKPFQRLFPIGDLKREVERHGIDILVVEPFSKDLSLLTASDFLEKKISPHFHPKEFVVGHDFAFGAGRQGTLEFLKTWCEQKHVSFWIQPPVEIDGERVSSRRIRELVTAGEVEKAARFLGREFSCTGTVEKGLGRGRQLQVPTVNLKLAKSVAPKKGVYATTTSFDGKEFLSVSNLGVSPTFGGDGEVKLETHIFDFSGDLYGKTVEVRFRRFLRDEKKFASVADLAAQIQQDMKAARQ